MTTEEKYYALVIGNNNYQYLEKLDAAENDAKVLADVLENNYGFDVKLLLNADYDTTVDSIHAISKKLTKDDNLLIFYAGHGELDKKQNRGYWLPVDASYEKRSKWISNAIVADELKATDAKHVLLIVDSCFSGSLMRSASQTYSNQKLDDEKYIKRIKQNGIHKKYFMGSDGIATAITEIVGFDYKVEEAELKNWEGYDEYEDVTFDPKPPFDFFELSSISLVVNRRV